MTAPLRILYLPPSSRSSATLARYSFLDEEIRALADAGVEAYVVSATESADWDRGRLHMRASPQDSAEQRARAVSFAARHAARIPVGCLSNLSKCYRSLRVERFAADVIRREGIALIHSYFGWPGGFGGALAKAETGVPLVAGLRGSDVNTLPRFDYGLRLERTYDRAFRRLLRTADRTVSVSAFLRRQAEQLGARPDRTTVILKGVRTDVFSARSDRRAARAALHLGPRPLILAVAGLGPIKGLNHVLDAMALVRRAGRDFTFIVCGEGPDRPALEAQIRRLGLEDHACLPGKIPRTDIAQYFAAADLFVHGSLIEASGNVLLEAMASGLPVVCTDAGGPAEYVRDGVTGYVVPIADPMAMADKVLTLLGDVDLRIACGRAARRHVEASFAYDRMMADTLDVYRSVLGLAADDPVRVAANSAEVSHA